jgi:WhiB family redox-sensing transcriptional regulator
MKFPTRKTHADEDSHSDRFQKPALVDDLELASAWQAWFYELLTDQDPPTTLEEIVGPRPAWQASAACRGMGVDLFFPKLGDVNPARAICARCEVRQECLDYIMAAESGAPGVWGGTTGLDRRRLKRASA